MYTFLKYTFNVNINLNQLLSLRYQIRKRQPTFPSILFRLDLFGAAHGWGEGRATKRPLSIKSVTHILQ